MKPLKTTTFTITLDDDVIKRLDKGRKGAFLSRVSFIRYLLNTALAKWEKDNA